MNSSQVMVVGAGPTGMLLAAELARRNVTVRLVEKREGPAEHSRALGVVPRTMEMFEPLGLTDEILTHGHRVHGIRIHGKDRRLLAEIDLRNLPTRYPFMLLLPQTRTEAILRQHLEESGVEIEWRTEVQSFREEREGVRVGLQSARGEQDVFCAYLAGCDGAHSTVRKGAGLEFKGQAYQQNWLLADVSLEPRLDPKFMHLFICPTGPIIFFPLPENVWRIVAMRPGTVQDAGRATLEEIEELLGRNQLGHLRPHRPLWVAGFAIHHRHTKQLRQGRVFLCGDAAHIHSPAGGQGMNTGLGDAFNLGWKLAAAVKGSGTEALLDSYEKERLPVIEGVLELTDRMTRMMIATAGPAIWIREWVMPFAAKLGMGKRMGEKLSQLQVGYPHSPAVMADARRKTAMIPVGSRIPSMPLKNQRTGREAILPDLLSRGRLVLLLFPDGTMRTGELRRITTRAGPVDWHWVLRAGQSHGEIREGDGAWTDSEGGVRAALGDPDHASWALMRPDGFLMARGEICETGLLEKFLNRLFGSSEEGSEASGP
jgi:2-polyprenyl-6-methoxyphenol hydroxylase-like FAD-dependent oxidoreductase